MSDYSFRCHICGTLVEWNGNLSTPPICPKCRAFFPGTHLENVIEVAEAEMPCVEYPNPGDKDYQESAEEEEE